MRHASGDRRYLMALQRPGRLLRFREVPDAKALHERAYGRTAEIDPKRRVFRDHESESGKVALVPNRWAGRTKRLEHNRSTRRLGRSGCSTCSDGAAQVPRVAQALVHNAGLRPPRPGGCGHKKRRPESTKRCGCGSQGGHAALRLRSRRGAHEQSSGASHLCCETAHQDLGRTPVGAWESATIRNAPSTVCKQGRNGIEALRRNPTSLRAGLDS